MNRWHQLADACRDSNLTAADKAVFLYLLSRADFETAELPAKFTPTREVIRRKTSLSRTQVGYSTRHLVRHGWLTAKGATGPGKPLEYAFAIGQQCDCTGRVHVPKRCQPAKATVSTTDTERCRPTVSTPQVTLQVPLRGNERERIERQNEPKRERPDWPLVWRLIRIVHADPCGGIHRGALAEKLGLTPYSAEFSRAIGIAYRKKKIDCCDRYIVKPAPPKEAAS